MTQFEKVQYTAKAQTTGGRNGASDGDDRHLNVEHFSPSTQGAGTDPTRRSFLATSAVAGVLWPFAARCAQRCRGASINPLPAKLRVISNMKFML
jgi:hypothetical protein